MCKNRNQSMFLGYNRIKLEIDNRKNLKNTKYSTNCTLNNAWFKEYVSREFFEKNEKS